MKKQWKTLLVLFLALFLSCGCGHEAAASGEQLPEPDNDLEKAFTDGWTLRLVPAELPRGDLPDGSMPVSLSPDGETVLWSTTNGDGGRGLSLVRDGKTIPVRFDGEKGAGDPYGKERIISRSLLSFPSP